MLGSIPEEAAFPALEPRLAADVQPGPFLGCERGRHCRGDSGWHRYSQKNERENPDQEGADEGERLSEQRQLCMR